MTDDLASYLLERYDEYEQVARAAADTYGGNASWTFEEAYDPDYGAEHFLHIADRTINAAIHVDADEPFVARELAHIARWDPSRVLSDVEAKRRIVRHHLPERPFLQQYEPQACGVCCYDDAATEMYPCPTLRLLAQPYADREDFRQEWSL